MRAQFRVPSFVFRVVGGYAHSKRETRNPCLILHWRQEAAMDYRRMGTSELEVSALGFGCWELGGTNYGLIDEAQATAAIHRALDLGVTLFDTAPGYGFGHSEEVLGRALGPRRRDIVVVSKTAISWDPITYT